MRKKNTKKTSTQACPSEDVGYMGTESLGAPNVHHSRVM